jgi:predicted transcriptional regulator
MDNTSRVAQWRQRMRDEGKEAITVWLSQDTKLRLEDLASIWHTTTSEMVEQALAQFHPGNPPRIGIITDTAQSQGLRRTQYGQCCWGSRKRCSRNYAARWP